MRVARSAPDFVEIRGRDPVRAPLLLGLALMITVTLSFASVPPISTQNVAGRLLVATFGAALVYFGRARRRRIDVRRDVVEVDGVSVQVPGGEARLQLTSLQREGAPGPTDYGVILSKDSGAAVPLLYDGSPDRVLRDLALLERVLPLPTETGWGLPDDSPWMRSSSQPSSRRRPKPTPPVRGRTKRSMVGTMLVGSAGVTAIIVYDVSQRLALGETPSALSLVLAVIAVTAVVTIALGIGSARTSIELGPDLRFTRFVFGVAIERRSVAKASIRDAFLVSPEGAAPRHLLLETTDGPVAFPCARDVGERFLDDFYGGGPEISSAPPVQSRT
jgi:hypothetical protein